jgi:hypothetical protein
MYFQELPVEKKMELSSMFDVKVPEVQNEAANLPASSMEAIYEFCNAQKKISTSKATNQHLTVSMWLAQEKFEMIIN